MLTSPEPVADSLINCDWPNDAVQALALDQVLGSSLRGDTVDVTAEVLTASEEVAAEDVADRFVAVQRVKRDTLHFKMTQNDDDQWGVCGYSAEGWGFFRHGYDGPGRTWTPAGASYKTVRALVDSIRKSAGKPPQHNK